MGSRGSMWVNKDGFKKLDAFKVKAIDTTGAGDAFIGGFSYHYSNSKDIIEAMRFGSAFAALSVTKRGTQKSYPTKEEVLQFLQNN